jgi:cation:H+ antiporter
MFADCILLIVGMVILVGGGEVMVRGASSLARSLGVSPLAIGLTVVAFGTSAPELAVNIDAALHETGELSFGNVFGSNMANIGLIVGLVAILKPLPIQNILIRRELPMMLLAMAAATILALDQELGGHRSAYMRGDGLILLLFFIVFLYYTVGDLLRKRDPERFEDEMGPPLVELSLDEDGEHKNAARDAALSVLGLVGLVGGANLTVSAAVGLAHAFEVPEVMIGLTIVSIGTSLPELVAAIICVRHGRADMAVGSVVGSNIFNTLLVAGVTATITPMTIPKGGVIDLAACIVLSLAFTLMASTHLRRIIRYEGVLLMAIYLAYMTWRTVSLMGPG